jgi:hypothetical protein
MPKKMNPASYATTGIKTILEIPNYIGCIATLHPTEQILIYEEVIQSFIRPALVEIILININCCMKSVNTAKHDGGHGFLCNKNIPYCNISLPPIYPSNSIEPL